MAAIVVYYNVHVGGLINKAVDENNAEWVAASQKAKAEWDKAIEAKQIEINQLSERQIAQSNAAESLLRQKNEQVNTLIAKLKENRHVTPSDDAKCVIPAGFVFDLAAMRNAAAGDSESTAKEVSAAPGGHEQAATGVTLSGLLGFMGDTYTVSSSYRLEALTWRGWYENQKLLFGDN